MNKEEILKLTCHRHVKIFKLHQLGLTNKEIAEVMKTNAGHVYNAIKSYVGKPERVLAAEKIQ